MIISRYLTKEVLQALIGLTLILLLIFLSQQLVRFLSYAASGKIAVNILFQLLGYETPFLLAVLLPLGLYLGVLLVYGRLYSENELRVMHACGLSLQRLTGITMTIALSVMAAVLILTLWINPYLAEKKQESLERGSGLDSMINVLMPGRFQVSPDGKRVVYVEAISRNHQQAKQLFIADEGKNVTEQNAYPWVVLSAERGYQVEDPQTHDRFMIATDGYRYEGVPGQNDYRIMQFKKYAVRAPDANTNGLRQIQEAIPTLTLLRTYQQPNSASELQWRLSLPLSVLILALLAVKLSQVRPGQGRYLMLLPAILIYVVYINLLFAARNMVEQSMVPVSVGIWWVHVLALALAAILFFKWRVSNA